MTIETTILFATYNGAKTLPRLLDAMCRQTLPQSQWKIIAVDNNSSDGTQTILQSYQDRLPLEILTQTRQGKAFALELGFQNIEGDLLILTDDDVKPADDWLEKMRLCAATQPDFDIFSGLIIPEWETSPPDWILNWTHHGVLYALNGDLDQGEIKPYHVSGPNSAFRTHILKGRGYLLNEDLGPNKNIVQFAMGEDTLFARTLGDEGAKAYHTHDAVVEHLIRSNYLNEAWILARAERHGMGMPVVRPFWFDHKRKICGKPATTLVRVMALSCILPFMRLLPPSHMRFKFLWNYYKLLGILKSPAFKI